MGKESKTKNKTITEAKLKKLARYELSFQDVFGPEEKEWGEVPVKKRISASPEDLLAALDKGEKLPYQQFWEEWLDPLWDWGPHAFYLYEEESWSGGEPGYPGLKGEPELTAEIWENMLEDALEECFDGAAYRKELTDLIRMREVAVPLRQYADSVKEDYLMYYYRKGLEGMSEKELLQYVLYADELAGKKNTLGMQIKAAGCFGGDKAYACNWKRAKDLYLQLLELDENPHSAAMLGHLYYDGRVGDGKPDYGKAFYYYSIGALGGHDEAALRLSDMFLKGEGVPKNAGIGYKLVWEQYKELLPFAADGEFDTRFPEAAWRAGEALRKNAELEEDYRQALQYLLQAEYALGERKKVRNGEAERLLERDINLSLQAVRRKTAEYPAGSPYLHPDSFFGYLRDFYDGKAVFSLQYKDLAGGRKKLTIRRLDSWGEPRPILLTWTEGEGKCLLADKLELEVSNMTAWEEAAANKDSAIKFDAYEDGRFLYKDAPVLVCAGLWKLKLPKDKK